MMETKVEIAARARKIAKQQLYGVLATQSVTMPGYPFGSLVTYAFDDESNVLLYIAKIAQHTRAARHGERNARSSRQGRRGFIPSARRAEGARASLCLKL